MVIKYSTHAMPFIGSMHYRDISEESIRKTIEKVKKFPTKNKIYIHDKEMGYVVVAALVKKKISIITVMTDMSRPICYAKGSKILEVS